MAGKAKARKGAPKGRAKAKVTAKAKAKPKPTKARPKAKATAKARPAKPAARAARSSNGRAARAPQPPRYRTLTPVLNVKGAARAIAFFTEAFGAKERLRMPGPDGVVMHAELEVGDAVLMVGEAMQNPETRSQVHLYVGDCDAVYERALAAGATAKMPLADMFWGDRFGSVVDPFGNIWSIATHKEDVSPEEMQRRMAQLPPPAPPPSDSV